MDNLNLKMKALEKEILDLKKEKVMCDAELKAMKDYIERKDKIHKQQMKEMQKCLAKAKIELARIEGKLRNIFTESQVKIFKSGTKNPVWSHGDIDNSISIYCINPKMYKFLYECDFPLPAYPIIRAQFPYF